MVAVRPWLQRDPSSDGEISMWSHSFRVVALLLGLIATTTRGTERTVDFVAEIQPLLKARCHSCHGAEKSEAGLRLDIRDRALAGGDSGRAIDDQSSSSPLLDRIRSNDPDLRMPPEGKPLTDAEVSLIAKWIDEGAHWPDGLDPVEKEHWAYQPIQASGLPADCR